MNCDRLFVYGTLRKGCQNPMSRFVTEHCSFHATGLVQGKLYEVNRYPGLVVSDNPEDQVTGELYTMNTPDYVLSRLDRYEECTEDKPYPHEFFRKFVDVVTDNGERITAWVYVYNRDTTQLSQIKSGDYMQFWKTVR